MTESTSIHSSLQQTLPVARVKQITIHTNNLWQGKENMEIPNSAFKIPHSTTTRGRGEKEKKSTSMSFYQTAIKVKQPDGRWNERLRVPVCSPTGGNKALT